MNQRVFVFFYAVFLAGCLGGSNPPKPGEDYVVGGGPLTGANGHVHSRIEGALGYRMQWRGDVLDVSVQLASPPETTRFFLPKSWRDGEDFSRTIAVAGARGPNGPLFLTVDRQALHIDVQTQDQAWVELHYVVRPTAQRSQLGPAFHDQTLVLYGPAFLVLPARQILDRVSNIPIEFLVPDDWRVVSTWPTEIQRPSSAVPNYTLTGFRAEDGAGLRDAFLVAGNLNVTQTPSLTVAFDPSFQGDRRNVVTLVEAAISFYAAQLGTLGQTRVFVQPSLPSHHGEFDGLGRRGGFVLRLPNTAERSPHVALLVLHEALHLWNGHHLVADPQQEPELRWFIEGVTHYSALLSGCHTGAYGKRFVLEELATIFDAYLRNPLTLAHSGTSLDHRRFPYDHGALTGFLLEVIGHHRDARTLQWIAELQKVAAYPQMFRKSDVESALLAILDPREAKTMLTLVRSETSSVPTVELLEKAGLHLLPSTGDRSARLMPIESGAGTYKHVLKFCKDDL